MLCTCIFPWNLLQKVKNSYKINKSIWADERKLHQMPKKKNYLSGWFLFWSIEFFISHFAEVFHFMETKIHHFFWNWKYFSHLTVLICSYESVSQCDKLFWPGFINPRYLLAFCTSTWVLLITWGQRWAQITLFIINSFFLLFFLLFE